MFCTTPVLGGWELEVLEEIDAAHASLRNEVRRCVPRCRRSLGSMLTAEAIAGSNAMDGHPVDPQAVEALLDGDPPARVPDEDVAETLAYGQVTAYLRVLHSDGDFSYDTGRLNALHWMLQGGRSPGDAGRWRCEAARVTDPFDGLAAVCAAPEATRIPSLMGRMTDWLNKGDLDQHALVRAAMAHLNLVRIRPWPCANGRMARALQTLLIARAGRLPPEFVSVEPWFGRPGGVAEYHRALAESGDAAYVPHEEARTWIRLSLLASRRRAEAVRRRLAAFDECWTRLMEFAELRGLAECQVNALHRVAVTGRLRGSRYRQAEGVPVKQAQREIRELTERSLLTAVGRTRGRYYVPGEAYPAAVLDTARTMLARADPYQD